MGGLLKKSPQTPSNENPKLSDDSLRTPSKLFERGATLKNRQTLDGSPLIHR